MKSYQLTFMVHNDGIIMAIFLHPRYNITTKKDKIEWTKELTACVFCSSEVSIIWSVCGSSRGSRSCSGIVITTGTGRLVIGEIVYVCIATCNQPRYQPIFMTYYKLGRLAFNSILHLEHLDICLSIHVKVSTCWMNMLKFYVLMVSRLHTFYNYFHTALNTKLTFERFQ